MKIAITVEQILSPALPEALKALREISMPIEHAAALERASNKILDEIDHYNERRDQWLKLNGEKFGEIYRISNSDPKAGELRELEESLAAEKFEINLPRIVDVPSVVELSANQYAALLECGLINEIEELEAI